MWKHSKIHKGKSFYLNAKYSKAGVRYYQLENAATGTELPAKYSSYQAVRAAGFSYQK